MNTVMTIINCAVRINSNKELNLFYYDDRKDIVIFSSSEGHSYACLEYMYSCKPCTDKESAQRLVDFYNSIGGGSDRFIFKLRKRLTK